MRRLSLLHRSAIFLLASLLLCVSTTGTLPIFPTTAASTRLPVRAAKGMVSSASDLAAQVGAEILKNGGNAVDAAIAVGLAMSVTYPSAGNLGGGGFMLIRMADGRTTAIDYRETAPAAATQDMYLDKTGKPIADASTIGYRAAGVPGTVAGFALALEKFGSMKWADLVAPAHKLANDGFPMTYWLSYILRNDHDIMERFPSSRLSVRELLSRFPESKHIYLKDGNFYQEGELFKQSDLAATLARLQKHGPREFYEGETAQLIVKDMQANNGLITLKDLKDYRPVLREPLKGTYRGYEIITMPPPSSGGIALIEMLNMLESFDLRGMGEGSSQKYHLLTEVMRKAFADRAEYLGDPDFIKVPVTALTSKRYASELVKSIDQNRATTSQNTRPGKIAAYESDSTTHYTIIDGAGNVVSNTYTLNGSYGSGAVVRGAGFLLNNEMDDFTTKPGVPNDYGLIQGEANAIAPTKRPLSSMTPTIVLKGGKPLFAIGSPGGPTIINTVLQVVINVIDHDMNIQQAIDAPRIHHQWLPDRIAYEPYGLSRDVINALKSRGQQLIDHPGYMGSAMGVMIEADSGTRLGGSDSRAPDGRAVGQ